MHTQVVPFDGFDPLDAIALDLERVDVVLVRGASGLVGEPGDASEEEAGVGERKQDEFIPVPLGRTLTAELPALFEQARDDPDITVATVCGGSLVLAMAVLLEGRHAITHYLGSLDMLDATGAHAVRARIADDGDLITGAGITSGLDLSHAPLCTHWSARWRPRRARRSRTHVPPAARHRIAREGSDVHHSPSVRPFADQSLTILPHRLEVHQHVRRRNRRRRPDHRPASMFHATPRRAPADV
ncbi:DJ-1/PfpI family protein [Streptomyces sp. BK79]|uniref:DJ-1/PfpI family protein n=1 Tax=Streptomyces sp. BK79 TaxID=3350097 RepID=UPI00376F64AE